MVDLVGDMPGKSKILYESVQIKSARVLTGNDNQNKQRIPDAECSNEAQQGINEEFEHTKPVRACDSLLGSFEIELECIVEQKNLEACDESIMEMEQYPLEFEMIYIANSANSKEDQLLERIELGPLTESGVFKFTIEDVKAPDYTKIPNHELLGITFALLRCAYRGKIFTNVGFYVETSYDSEELNLNPPEIPQLENLTRSIYFDSQINDFPFNWQATEEYYKQKPSQQPDGILNFNVPGLFGDSEPNNNDGADEEPSSGHETGSEDNSGNCDASNQDEEDSCQDVEEQEMDASEENDENVDINCLPVVVQPEAKIAKLEIEPVKSNEINAMVDGLAENHKSD